MFTIAVFLALAACQRAPAPTLPRSVASTSFTELMDEGDLQLRQENWPDAIRIYEHALVHDPGNVTVHYRLGVALANQGRTRDAVAALTWVVDHAPHDSDEARLARQWLANEATVATTDAPAAIRAPDITGNADGASDPREMDPDARPVAPASPRDAPEDVKI
jgi:predicted Zn-dependent protease